MARAAQAAEFPAGAIFVSFRRLRLLPCPLTVRATGMVIGDIGFRGPPDAAGIVEIGYSVVAGRRRRGYATEADEGVSVKIMLTESR
jgi:RimJ/RimL family protein N-acetyltransferase